jgi:hypothetical protein
MSTPYSSVETTFAVNGSAQTAAQFAIKLNGSVPFTITAWVNVQSIQDPADLLTKDGVFRFGVQGGQLYVEIAGFPALWSDGVTNPVTQNAWHYVACVYTGTQLQLYIDGVLDCAAGVTGQGTDNANAFIIANNLQGRLNSVRVYDSALPAGVILEAMFQPDPAQSYVANFDFTINPPADTSANNLPLVLSGTTHVNAVAPAVALGADAYCQPIRDPGVNPGGAGNDPYTIQAWVWIANPTASLTADGLVPSAQAVFVNQLVDAPVGIALFLVYDSTANLYRLASLRGNVESQGSTLVSQGALPFGQWVNVATTYNPATTTLALYVNGVLDSSSAAFPAIAALASPNVLIGGAAVSTQPSTVWTLQGFIQTVDVWNVSLTAAQIQQWLTAYPVQETGLTAHYDFTSQLARNELNGNLVGLADRARVESQASAAGASTATGTARKAHRREREKPHYQQLAPDVMQRLRDGISFADAPQLDRLLDDAARRELEQNLHLFVPAAMVPRFRARLAGEWARVRHLMRERPQELRFLITHHKIDGEHILIHHTPVRSTVVFRAPVESLDDCTMWRIRVIWTILMGILSVFGVTAALSNRALQFIQQRILGNAALMRAIGNIPAAVTATGLYVIIKALYNFGVLWPLIKIVLTTMGWWALTKLLVKVLIKFFGAALAVAETIASLIVAVAQLIYVLTQQPAQCPLIPSGETTPAIA